MSVADEHKKDTATYSIFPDIPEPTDERAGHTLAKRIAQSMNNASPQSNGRMSPACMADKPSTYEGKSQVRPSSVLILWLLTLFSASLRNELGPPFLHMASTSCRAADWLWMPSVVHSCLSALCLLLLKMMQEGLQQRP